MKNIGKQLSAILLVLVLLLSVIAPAITSVSATAISKGAFDSVRGDVNGNGVTDQDDVALLTDILSGASSEIGNADVDGNNIIEQYDLTVLQSIVNNEILKDGDLLDEVVAANLQTLYVKGDSHQALEFAAQQDETKTISLLFGSQKDWTTFNALYFDLFGLKMDVQYDSYTVKVLSGENNISTEITRVVSNCWQKQKIFLSEFKNVDFSAVSGLEFSFAAQEDIEIYIDNLCVGTEEAYSPVLADLTANGTTAEYSTYEKDIAFGWYRDITNGTSANEWNNRVEFANTAHTDAFGSVYTTAEFVVYLEQTNNFQMKVVAGSGGNSYHALNNKYITVRDAITGEVLSVGADGKVPTGRWLRIVADLKGLLGVDAITSTNCYRIGLTHTAGVGSASVRVARVLAVDPITYVYEIPAILQASVVDITGVLGNTGTKADGNYYSTYKKDETSGWYNHTTDGSSANEWNNRLELANTAQTYALGSKYTTAEFVVYLEQTNNFQMKVVAGSSNPYHALNSAGITVYDAITGEVISVGADGKVPTGRWLRIVADLKILVGSDTITTDNCYRIGLTHTAGVGSASVRVARALAVDPATYVYEIPAIIQAPSLDITDILGKTGNREDGSYYSTYKKDEVFGWYNHTTDGGSANEWNNRLELANTAHTDMLGSKYTTAEFVVYLEHNNNFQMKVVAGSNNPYHALNSAGITVYDAITGEVISVGADGKVPTGRWLRITADLKVLLGVDTITSGNCYRIGLTHTAGVGSASVRVARALAIDPAAYVYEVPAELQISAVDVTGVLGKTGTCTEGIPYSTYVKDEKAGWYNHTTDGRSATEWNNRLELADKTHTYGFGSKYTTAEFVVYLERTNNFQLKVVAGSSNLYHALNSAGIMVYDAITGEVILVGDDGKVPTERWLRIVADLKVLVDADTITTDNCYRIGLTHTAGVGSASMRVARAMVVDPAAYSYVKPDFVKEEVISFLDFTSVLGAAGDVVSYAYDEAGYYNYTANSGSEWTTRLQFANSTQTAEMGDQFTQVEFVVQLPADYAAKLQVFVNSSYKYLNDGNIKVYDAITNEQITVGSDGSVPTGKWLRIVADIKSIVGASITGQNCSRIALTHKGNSATTVTKIAHVLAIDPTTYVYEIPECVSENIVKFLDFTSVYAKTDSTSSYALDEEAGYYNYTATANSQWTSRIDFAGSTQTAQMGDQYTHVEFVVQLPTDYAATLQVMVNSSYKNLNDGKIKVYDAVTNEQITVGSDGKVPTGKWLRIVADIKSMVGAPVTAQNCWRVALTHNGNSTISVTKVARVLAIYPAVYVYETPEAVN